MRHSIVATALVAVFISCLGTCAQVKAGGYDETDLVADVTPLIDKNGIKHEAKILDPFLVNPWGIAESQASPFWVSDNGTGASTLYVVNSSTQIAINQSLRFVRIPSPGGDLRGMDGHPTGAVFNPKGGGTGAFQIKGFTASGTATKGAAVFLFATEDGTIVGWNPGIFPDDSGGMGSSTFGIIAVDKSSAGAVYKGLAIAADPDPNSNGAFLYAANFHSGMVEMYDRDFNVTSFTDPNLPPGFAPFNLAVLGGKLYVTFAIRSPKTGDNVPGKGSGIVSVFNLDGTFNQRFAEGGHLKAPWGMALAPSNFGPLAGKLLVGNFGDGHINAFDPTSGAFIDHVRDSKTGKPLVIDGLWALQVGNGGNGGLANTVYFTAGPNDEKDGLFGGLTPNP